MQVQVDIGFEQLVKIAKKLPETEWQKLKKEVEGENQSVKSDTDLLEFLLNGPTYSEKQIEVIEQNTKAINKRRKI